MAAADPAQQQRIGLLCQRIVTLRDPDGLRGAHAAAMAPQFGVPEHLAIAAIARLTGRDVLEVAAEAKPPPPAPAAPPTLRERRRERQEIVARLQEREPF